MEATSIHKLVLLYPYAGNDMSEPFEQFQTVTDDDKLTVAVRVNPELVGFKGMAHFSKVFAGFLLPMILASKE